MKIFLLSCLLLSPLLLVAQSDADRAAILHDTLRNREDRKDFKRQREAWLAGMHRAAPGVDPAIINAQIRESRLRDRQDRKERGTLEEERVAITETLVGRWVERGSRNQAGRTWVATTDTVASRIYVAADGGQIWRGSLDGDDWVSIDDERRITGIRHLSVDYSNPSDPRLVVVAPGRAWRVTLDGREWEEAEGLENIARWGGFERVAAADTDPDVIWGIGQEWDYGEGWGAVGTLYRSIDGARSFDTVLWFDRGQMVDICSIVGTDSALVLIEDTFYRLGPTGRLVDPVEIEQIEGGIAGASRLDLRRANDGTLFMMVRRGSTNEMHGSVDGGVTWTRTATGLPGLFSRSAFAIDPEDPAGFLMIGGVNLLYSRDAGLTWDTTNKWGQYYGDPAGKLHADIPWVSFLPLPGGGRTLFVSTDGGLYRSEDRLSSVRNLSLRGLGNAQYYSVYTSTVDTNRVFAGSQDQGFQRSDSLGDGEVLDFVQTISGDYGHITSSDGGRSVWTNYPGFSMYYPDALKENIGWGRSRDFITEGHLWIPPIIAEPDTPCVAWMAGGGTASHPGARLIRTEYVDGKVEMTPGDFDFNDGGQGASIVGIGISPVNPDYRWVMTSESRTFRSVDRGKNWDEVDDGLQGHYFYGTVILPSKRTLSRLWIAGSGYSNPGVWVSHDGGRNFDTMTAGLPPTLVYDMDVSEDESLIFAATAVGPYVWVADSSRWFDLSGAGAPNQTWWSVEYLEEGRVARFGTYGRGIWDLRLEDVIPSSVDRIEPRTSPRLDLAFLQSADRPEFRLESERSGSAVVRLFDTDGRLVATLHDGAVEAGTNRIGAGDLLDRLPSGLYLCVASMQGGSAWVTVPIRR